MKASLTTLYKEKLRKRQALLLLLFISVVVSVLIDITVGPAALGWDVLVDYIFNSEVLAKYQRVILTKIRLPYSIMAILVGAILGWSGAEMQTVLKNPLASPFTLGVTAAAIVGAAFAMVFNIESLGIPVVYAVPLCSFLAALCSITAIQFLSNYFGGSVDSIVLFGIAMVFALNALVSLLMFITDADTLQEITFWTMGSLARANWGNIAIVSGLIILVIPLAIKDTNKLTLLKAGENNARSMGIDVEKLRRASLIRVSLLSAVAVSFVGTIGFIGLVGPHIARLLVGEDHRLYLPASALSGALLLSLSSIASKMIIPGVVIPIGIVTALVGVPLFLILIISQRRVA